MEVIVAQKGEFPGFRVRMLADRDEGAVIWEVSYLNEAGEITSEERRKIRYLELLVLPDLLALLKSAVKELTPRALIDKVKIELPEGALEK